MSTQTNLILTSDNFFDTIEFQKKTEIEQVAYILFYVTEVAHLRKDMISDVIADRLQDQYESFFQRNKGASNLYYTPIKKEQVENILKGNPEWFQKVSSGIFADSDRGPNMRKTPYRLTQSKKEDLWKIFDKDVISKINLQKKKLFIDKTLSTLKSATKLFSVLLASKRPLITELADKLRLKYPLLPTISPCPTMRLEAIRSIIPISCRRYPKSV